jgi:hypothetical protein
VATCPEGTLACSIDVEAAFRTIPITPSQWPYLAVRIDDAFYIDKCLPFGARTSVGIHGKLMDAWTDALKRLGMDESLSWVDDNPNWQFPSKRTHSDASTLSFKYRWKDLSFIFDLAHRLGIPIHPEKIQHWSSSVIYIGFVWDMSARTVSLPEKKRLKYLAKLEEFLQF